ncbi:hypothetical protein Tco_1162908 [Tanacetum coccineum]
MAETTNVLNPGLTDRKFKLEKTKSKASLLKAQPSFPNVYQLILLLVKSLNPELAQLPINLNFSASIPIELKEIPAKSSILVLASKVDALENIKLDLLAGLLVLPKKIYLIKVQLSKLKVLVSLPSLLNKVVEDLDRFSSVIELASQKASDQGVPSVGPTSTHPVACTGYSLKDKNQAKTDKTKHGMERADKNVAAIDGNNDMGVFGRGFNAAKV